MTRFAIIKIKCLSCNRQKTNKKETTEIPLNPSGSAVSQEESSKQIHTLLAETQRLQHKMQHSLDVTTKALEFILTKIATIELDGKTTTKELLFMNDRLQRMETRFNSFEEKFFKNYITIDGIPEFENEDIKTIVMKIGSLLKAALTEKDILLCERDDKCDYDIDMHPRLIIVELKSNYLKEIIIKNHIQFGPFMLKQLKIDAPGIADKFSVNDYLKPNENCLFYQVKKLRENLRH